MIKRSELPSAQFFKRGRTQAQLSLSGAAFVEFTLTFSAYFSATPSGEN
jgi:hypothetical protein